MPYDDLELTVDASKLGESSSEQDASINNYPALRDAGGTRAIRRAL